MSPDGRLVLMGFSDRTARLWEVRTGKPIGQVLRHTDLLGSVGFSSDGRTVVVHDKARVMLWTSPIP